MSIKSSQTLVSDALSKVNQLNGVTYHYNTDNNEDTKKAGVIAQDVLNVLPFLIH